MAIGHPTGGMTWTLTAGLISARSPTADDAAPLFQTDADINPGNSGGPLLTLDGRVIGINASAVRKLKDGEVVTGLNFALRSAPVIQWLDAHQIQRAKADPTAPKAPAAPLPSGTRLQEAELDQLSRHLGNQLDRMLERAPAR